MKISMKLVYQYLTIFFNFQIRSSHLHPLQVENCDSNSRLVVADDDNGKFSPERVNKICRSTNYVIASSVLLLKGGSPSIGYKNDIIS